MFNNINSNNMNGNIDFNNHVNTNQANVVSVRNSTQDTCSSLGCSIFNLLCCFFWLGIPAIIFSSRAQEKNRFGRYQEAQSDAKCAKIFNIVGITIGSIALVVYIIVQIVYLTTISKSSLIYG